MTFPEGTWTTEYAVRITLTDGPESVYFASTNRSTPENACEQFRLKGADAEIVTRETFHTGWRPVAEPASPVPAVGRPTTKDPR